MRKRASCLEDIIRALQAKAETNEDPALLQHRIGELLEEIQTYKREEEKRRREISEMREIIRELKQENKNMRQEMKRIRESVERKESMERKSSADKKRILARNEERSLVKKKKGESNLVSRPFL